MGLFMGLAVDRDIGDQNLDLVIGSDVIIVLPFY